MDADEEFEGEDDYGFEPFEQVGESLFGEPEPAPVTPPPAAESAPGLAAPSHSDRPERSERPIAPPAPLALYRRYRPDSFAQVIGQEHVTEPLQRALANNRVNHAYLFSGPRGCGKTTSARILARCLNCEQGPTPEPCGECRSCRDLARGGPGSIDVIEIDAASHGGVDDARDLREGAYFAPVHSRYKIYVIDEAHMVTSAGFNALLKVVEEPPPHVKFIFATTEPEKVIGTIRSRTHHYPFRLVPPKTLQAYLGELCGAEGITVDPLVLPLVVRAGQGSVRDSLSVLDQLLGGATKEGVSYEHAAALLGYTPDSLLDEIVDAFAAGDAHAVFATIDKVIEVGQDPRRFGEDLLRRLRDLVIVAAVPDAITSGLVDVAGDQAERMQSQAAALGPGELARGAEVIANGLTEMRGTTAPRLHLELMCARVLLPGADVDDRGVHARLDRLERRLDMVGQAGFAPRDSGEQPPAQVPATVPVPAAPSPMPTPQPEAPQEIRPVQAEAQQQPPQQPGPRPASGAPRQASGPRPVQPPQAPQPQPSEPVRQGPPQGGNTSLTVTDVRRLWPDVLEEVKRRRRFTWILISQNAQVVDVQDGRLTLALKNAGARDHFARGGNEDVLIDAIVQVLGAQLRIEAIIDGGGGQPPASGGTGPRSSGPGPQSTGPQSTGPASRHPGAGPAGGGPGPQNAPGDAGPSAALPASGASAPERAPSPRPGQMVQSHQMVEPDDEDAPPPPPDDAYGPPADQHSLSMKAREGIRKTQFAREQTAEPEPEFEEEPDDAGSSDSLSPDELIRKHLGAELIDEEGQDR